MDNVLDGTDLILSVGGKALGYSTGCKITTSFRWQVEGEVCKELL